MLSIEHLAYRYRTAPAPALDNLSLQIPAGSIYGLLGPNGAGKTTLISLLAGLLRIQQGQATLDGLPLARVCAADPCAIALVPQDYAFYPMLTVGENLRFFAGALGLASRRRAARIDAAVSFARLEQVVGKRAETLSGGLRRRLNLAIGLLGEPRLLLLDEPTVGVDPQSRHFLLEAIKTLPASGMTVIYTSHYMNEIEAICPRITIIDQGRILAEGSLADILSNAEAQSGQHPSQQLDLYLTEPLPIALAERLAASTTGERRYRLPLTTPAALPRLLDELAAAGCQVQALNMGQHNLEQVFMRLTHRSLRD